jgi:MFS family permease
VATSPTIHLTNAWLRPAAAMFAIGWGANMFAPLLDVYRPTLGAVGAAALFGAYIIGLIPMLLLAPRIADRVGRRPVLRGAIIVSVVGSIVLLIAGASFGALFVGRVVVGVAAGSAFGPGTAWVKELSARGGSPDSGARRAAIALSAGFGVGPFLSGLLAQWVPGPDVVPYVVHVVLAMGAAAFVWGALETRTTSGAADCTVAEPQRLGPVLRTPVFRRAVASTAPWVFGAASAGLAALPGLVDVGGYSLAVSGGAAAVTLGTGLLVQSWARRLAARAEHLPFVVGLAAMVIGMVIGVVIAFTHVAILLLPATIALGGAYGLLLISGLTTIDQITPAPLIAGMNGIFYSITYVGFVFPLLVSSLAPIVGAPAVFGAAAIVGIVTMFSVRRAFGPR